MKNLFSYIRVPITFICKSHMPLTAVGRFLMGTIPEVHFCVLPLYLNQLADGVKVQINYF